MSCDPILEMAISQDDLRAMYERLERNGVKQPARPGLGCISPGAHVKVVPGVFSYGAAVVQKKPNKFRNVKVEYEGMKFDSKHELKCWQNLKLREKAGEISDLERQVKFDLVVKDKKIGKFTADFRWWEGISCVVADAKSEITRKETAYRLRKKIFEAQYAPLTIREL